MSTSEILQRAIRQKQPITCYYDGLYREYNPHTLGYTGSKLNVHGWQSGGQSKNPIPEWRCFEVRKMTSVTLSDAQFVTGTPGRRSQWCVDQIIAQVRL